MIYDQDELKQAVEQGERKLAERRQRARRQKKQAIFALVLAGLSLVAGAGLWLVSRAAKNAPKPPVLVVTWPKSKTPQVIGAGQTVLSREGQPFEVSVSDPANWNVSWGSSGVQNTGDSFEWAPQKNGDSLVAQCRAKNSGWKPLSSAAFNPNLTLSAAMPRPVPAPGAGEPFSTMWHYARTLPANSKQVWLCPFIQASGNVAWDERALPALSDAALVVPSAALSAKLAGANASPTPAIWQILPSFDGSPSTQAMGDTYASLRADDLENVMPRVGAQLVRLAPDASIKWIVRLDKTPPEGVVRLSFDGKRGRQAWVKRAGQTTGTPITGWEAGQWKGVVASVAPSPTPTSRQ